MQRMFHINVISATGEQIQWHAEKSKEQYTFLVSHSVAPHEGPHDQNLSAPMGICSCGCFVAVVLSPLKNIF